MTSHLLSGRRIGQADLVCLLLWFSFTTVHAAEQPSWIADANGCKVWDPQPIAGETITWSGACKGGFADGPGTLMWIQSDGSSSRSEGAFVLGKQSGHVVAVYRSGTRFEGEMVNGVASGPGQSTFANGDSYTGNYVNNLQSGKGVFTWQSGARYEGEFVDDHATGKGVLTWPNGDRYEGDVVRGRMQGKGVLVKADGSRQQGDFNNVWIPPEMAGWIDSFDTGFKASLAKIALSRPEQTEQGTLLGTADASSHFTWTVKKSSGWAEYDAAALNAVQATPAALNSPRPNYTFETYFQYGGHATDTHYGVKEYTTGSSIKKEVVKVSVPPDKSYAELTEEQQNTVKALYEPMAVGDEPPYPLYGTRPILDAVHKIGTYERSLGYLSLAVTVDSSGKPTQVAILKSPDDDTARAVATILMLQKYKPAICAGTPCKMVYPFRMNFIRGLD